MLCNYCGRTFNNRTAERHISFCKDQKLRGNIASRNSNNSTTSRSLSSNRSSASKKTNLTSSRNGILV